MARNITTKGSLDLTEFRGESHLSEISMSESVSGTSPDDLGDETTDVWPDAIDRDEFTDLQAAIIEKLVLTPDATGEDVAKQVRCSDNMVYKVRQKLSAMGHQNDVPFYVPEEAAQSVAIAQPYLDDEKEESDNNSTTSGGTEKHDAETIREILGRYEVLGQNCSEIAAEMGFDTHSEVSGVLAMKDKVDKDEYIVPEQETEEQTEESRSVSLDATAETVDVTACDCPVPHFETDTAEVGPFSIQVLFCGACDYEFTTLRVSNDED